MLIAIMVSVFAAAPATQSAPADDEPAFEHGWMSPQEKTLYYDLLAMFDNEREDRLDKLREGIRVMAHTGTRNSAEKQRRRQLLAGYRSTMAMLQKRTNVPMPNWLESRRGRLPSGCNQVEIVQVVSDTAVLVRLKPRSTTLFWIEVGSSAPYHDDMHLDWSKVILEDIPNHTYTTVMGASKTVQAARMLDQRIVDAAMKEYAGK